MNFDLIIHKRNFVVLHMNSKFKQYFTHEFEVLNEYIFYCLSLDFSGFFYKKKKKNIRYPMDILAGCRNNSSNPIQLG
jgi:thiamine transporter ThiT